MNNGSETTSKLKRKDRKKKNEREKGYILYHPQIGRFSGNYDRRRDPGRMFRRSVVLLYRICLNYAASWMQEILGLCQGHPGRTALWMGALFLMAVITGLLVKWEPMISGSGIPQLKGGDGRKTASELAPDSTGEVSGGISGAVRRIGTWTGGPVHPARGYGRKRRLKSAEEGEDGGEISSDLWCECRDGCRVPGAACRCDVYYGRNS